MCKTSQFRIIANIHFSFWIWQTFIVCVCVCVCVSVCVCVCVTVRTPKERAQRKNILYKSIDLKHTLNNK